MAETNTAPYREMMRRTLHLGIWTIAWVLSLAVAKFGHELWQTPAISWAVIALNLAIGVGLIVSFTRYLRAVDDLDRKIMLDALAVTLGVAGVVGFAWIVAHDANLLSADISAAVFAAILSVVFLVAVVAGRIRYR